MLVTDLYARKKSVTFSGMLRRVQTEADWRLLAEQAGFAVETFSDQSQPLLAMLGQMIFDHGAEAAYAAIGASKEEAKAAGCGYFLAVLRR